MHSLDTVEYYIQPSDLGEVYELCAYVNGIRHSVAKRASFKRIEAIHDYILERGFVTLASVEDEQRKLRTFPDFDSLEIVFPE